MTVIHLSAVVCIHCDNEIPIHNVL